MDFSVLMHLLSWDLYTKTILVIDDFGLLYLPLVIFLYTNYFSILEKDANTSVVDISSKKMFVSVATYVVIYFIAIVPSTTLSSVELLKDKIYKDEIINTETSKLNQSLISTYSQFSKNSTIDLKMPILFGLFDVLQYSIVGGVKNAVDTLNIKDLRSSMVTAMQNSAIKDPNLAGFYNDVVKQCYNPARVKFDTMIKDKRISTDNFWSPDIDPYEYDWVGGSYYLKTKGFYKPCPSGNCLDNDSSTGIQFLQNNKPYRCDLTYTKTLKPALFKEFKLDNKFKNTETTFGKISAEARKDQALRSYLKAEKTVDAEEGKEWGILGALKAFVSWAAGIIGMFFITLLKMITTYLITVILPLLQALLLFLIVVLLPILLPLAGFKPEYLFGILAAMFSIHFVTVIITLIGIIDNSLLALIASNAPSDNAVMQAIHIASGGGGLEFFLINLLILFFYIIAIKMWFEFMAEFGSQGTKAIGRGIGDLGDMGIGDKGGEWGWNKYIEYSEENNKV